RVDAAPSARTPVTGRAALRQTAAPRLPQDRAAHRPHVADRCGPQVTMKGIGNMSTAPAAAKDDKENVHLIVVQDEEITVEHHPEDWLAFLVFWSLAFIVFLQFFTRYVLNDSLAWTEEIARYGLMWLTFIGGAVVTRKNSHI